MKKVILPLVALMLSMVACQKENEGILTLEVEEYNTDAKLHLNDDNFAVWDNGDEVQVNGTDYTVSVSGTTATLTGVTEASTYTAIYPAAWATGNTTLNIPGMQTYRENNGIQIIDAPMYAYSDGNTLKFRNLGALLAVTVNNETGSALNVVSIDVTAQGASLCGSATISNYTSEEPAMSVSGHNTVTLYCNTTIAANGSKEFYISLPPVTASELTITVNDATQAYTKTRTSSLTLGRNSGQRVTFSTSEATVAPHSGPLPNQIWYICTRNPDGYFEREGYGANYVDNTYTNATTTSVITFDGPITTIPDEAFWRLRTDRAGYLKSIILPANVTTIGVEAFYNSVQLASIIMPGVTSIGEGAFGGCSALTTLSLPCLLQIEQDAFNEAGLVNVSLPNLISVSYNVFMYCESLTSVSLPKVTFLNDFAFTNCTQLATVSIPNATNIGSCAFKGCNSLTTVYADNVVNIGDKAFQGCTSLAHFYSNTAAPTMDGSDAFTSVPDAAVLHLPSSCQGSTWNYWPGNYSYDR